MRALPALELLPFGGGGSTDTRRAWAHAQAAPGFALCWPVCSAPEMTLRWGSGQVHQRYNQPS